MSSADNTIHSVYIDVDLSLATDGSLATSSSPNQSQLSLPGLVLAFATNENNQCNHNNNGGLNVTTTTTTTSSATGGVTGSNKSRSHSTTSLYNQHPNGKRLMRERKTVCSLHPLSTTTSNEYALLDALNCSGHTGQTGDLDSQHLRDRDDSENEAFSCSLPGSAVDSRRGSGISTRCAESATNRSLITEKATYTPRPKFRFTSLFPIDFLLSPSNHVGASLSLAQRLFNHR